jgi:hypothetical protein
MRFEINDDAGIDEFDEDTDNKEEQNVDEATKAELEKSGVYAEKLDPKIEMTEDDKDFLSDLRFFCSEYIAEFSDGFWKAVESHEISPGRRINKKIKDYIKDNKLDLPVFVVRDGTEASSFLDQNGLTHTVGNGHFLLEFRLPKQLGYFWWKDRRSDHKNENVDAKRKKIEDAGIAWGDIYRSVRPIMWDKIINQFGSGKIDFKRINPPRTHNTTGYYYLFDASHMPTDQIEQSSSGIDVDKD